MPLTNSDYRDILRRLRRTMRETGLGPIDERIMSELKGTEGPFFNLTSYLKFLISELSLGSDEQLRNVLRRVRRTVETQSGESVKGFKVQLSPEESRLYGMEFLDLGPTPELQGIIAELRAALEDLQSNRQRHPEESD